MSKGFKYFFISCARVLVLGHSVLPHDHLKEPSISYEIKASKAHSLIEILKLALANNLGANHLEEFKNGKKFELPEFFRLGDFSCATTSFEEMSCGSYLSNNVNYNPPIVISINYILTNAPLRAPPFSALLFCSAN